MQDCGGTSGLETRQPFQLLSRSSCPPPVQPLTGLQSNGPGLRYKILWRQKDADQEWVEETVANVSQHVVTETPTYAPYEVKVQAVNDYGSGPEPEVVLGYSGENREFCYLSFVKTSSSWRLLGPN